MAKSAQQITLSASRDIPFDTLMLSQSNVRRIKAGVSVEELAEYRALEDEYAGQDEIPEEVNALHEKVSPYGAGISASGLTRRMVQAVDLDMVDAGWEWTVDTYLNRVPKARILEAVREAKGEGTAQLLDHLEKGEMATEAERLLIGFGWLPEVLLVWEKMPS
jgi:hypothetical protein